MVKSWNYRCGFEAKDAICQILSLFLCLRESKNDLKLPSLEIINECQHDKRRHRFPGAKQEIRKWTNKNWSKKLQRKWGVVKVHCNLRLFHFTDFFCNHNHKIVNHQDFMPFFKEGWGFFFFKCRLIKSQFREFVMWYEWLWPVILCPCLSKFIVHHLKHAKP